MARGQISRPDIEASNLELQKKSSQEPVPDYGIWNEIPRSLKELPNTSFKARILRFN